MRLFTHKNIHHKDESTHQQVFPIFTLFSLSQASYIAQCIEEIKQELRIDNINVKCNAVAKLTYVSGAADKEKFVVVADKGSLCFACSSKCAAMTSRGRASTSSK